MTSVSDRGREDYSPLELLIPFALTRRMMDHMNREYGNEWVDDYLRINSGMPPIGKLNRDTNEVANDWLMVTITPLVDLAILAGEALAIYSLGRLAYQALS